GRDAHELPRRGQPARGRHPLRSGGATRRRAAGRRRPGPAHSRGSGRLRHRTAVRRGGRRLALRVSVHSGVPEDAQAVRGDDRQLPGLAAPHGRFVRRPRASAVDGLPGLRQAGRRPGRRRAPAPGLGRQDPHRRRLPPQQPGNGAAARRDGHVRRDDGQPRVAPADHDRAAIRRRRIPSGKIRGETGRLMPDAATSYSTFRHSNIHLEERPDMSNGLLNDARWDGKLFDGAWRSGKAGSYDVIEKATGKVLARIGKAQAEDVAASARKASLAQRAWAMVPLEEKAAIFRRVINLIEQHRNELAEWIMRDSGALRAKAEGELRSSINSLNVAAAMLTEPPGLVLPSNPGRLSYARRVPHGVVGIISPFNFPLVLSMRAVAPALATGNAVIVKPDPQTAVS